MRSRPVAGQKVLTMRRRATNTAGYYTQEGGQYVVSRVYPEVVELRGDFTNRLGTDLYRDRMHSVPISVLSKTEPDWIVI
jgi:hypothetical protein